MASNRDYKQFAQNEFYHVYNRGNFKQDVFRDTQDYANFLKRLALILDRKVSKAAFDIRVDCSAAAPVFMAYNSVIIRI